MVKENSKDSLFLATKSRWMRQKKISEVVTDLLDTLRANLDHCVGMAANMMGVEKKIVTWQ